MGRLGGKVALITGGASGIGQTIALLLAREGARVVVADLAKEAGEETTKMIETAGGQAISVLTDVSKASDVKNAIGKTVHTYGRLDILINSAGIGKPEGSTVDCTEEVFDKIFAVNVKGVWLCMKYAIPEMLKGGGGTIVNLASAAAIRAHPGIPAYSASKAAVVMLTRVAGVEYAGRNVRVNCVSPGPTLTKMVSDMFSKATIEQLERVTPQGRLGKPEEVAKTVLFLASDESSHITAEMITIDGGFTSVRA